MIAIDTNVLLRYLLQDDEIQSAKANKIFQGNTKILVTDIVLVEALWTLKGRKYQLEKEIIVNLLHSLFAEPLIVFEDEQVVWCALKDFANAKPVKVSGKQKYADFSDALIVNKAKKYGQSKGVHISQIYTFDKAALEIDGTKEP
jgi:predicted nucleic-acid-binding protein